MVARPAPSASGPRVPPHNVEAEESVLGAVMLSEDAANEVMDRLGPEDFYIPAHQAVFETIVTLYNANEPIDAITVSDLLRRKEELDRIGGVGFITRLMDAVPTASNVGYYADIVEEHSLRRSLLQAGAVIGDLATKTDQEIEDVVDEAERTVLGVAEKRVGEGLINLAGLINPELEKIEALEGRGTAITGLATGFRDLDKELAGLQPANLVIIAARPGMGKCLHGDTLVVDPKTGARVPIRDLVESGLDQGQAHVLSLDEDMKLVQAAPIAAQESGVQEVYKVHTRLGHEIVASANHPFRTVVGWTRLDELQVGDHLAVARKLDVFGVDALPEEELEALVTAALGGRISPEAFKLPELQLRRVLAAMGVFSEESISCFDMIHAEALQHLARRVGVVLALDAEALELRVSVSTDAMAHVLWDRVSAIEGVGVAQTYDLQVPVHENFLANDFVVHNSALATNIAANVALHGGTVAMFSLEMGAEEIVQRFLCSIGRVDSMKLRAGQLSPEQWQKVVHAASRLYEANVYVDDSSNVMMTDIRAKARRLKRSKGLDLIVVDYLQLMQGRNRENRQQEIAEISRNLKNLARELHIPIIAISQLNRALEQREDKRPRLGDLRECLGAETPIRRSDTGATITIAEIARQRLTRIPVWSLTADGLVTASVLERAWSTGVKPIFKLTTRSGRTIRATGNHPLLTFEGWLPIASLQAGDRIAVPRQLLQPQRASAMTDDEVVLLAHLIGDGSYVKRQPLRYTSDDPANHQAVIEAAVRRFGVIPKKQDLPDRSWQTRLSAPYRLARGRRNPVCAWLDELGIYGQRSKEKRIPDPVFGLPDDQVRLFLRHLWATDGSMTVRREGNRATIYYATASRGLAEDVNALLLRLDFQPRIRTVSQGRYSDAYHVALSGAEQQRRFVTEVGCHGRRGEIAETLLAAVAGKRSNTNVDTIPRQVWSDVRAVMKTQGVTHRELASHLEMQYCGTAMFRPAPSRERLARVGGLLQDERLLRLASNDVLWDEIATIEPDGEEETFDAVVPGTHNFLAGEIVVHNSGAIEQDSDVVMFIYRDEYYNPETSEYRGMAEVNIAKHRAGATGRVQMTFLPEFTLFADLGRDVAP